MAWTRMGSASGRWIFVLLVIVLSDERGKGVSGLVFKANGGPPKLSIVGDYPFLQKIECRHGNSTENLSLAIIRCSSASNCDKKFPCLLNNLMCSARDRILRGGMCMNNIFADHGPNTNQCLAIDPDHQSSGLVQCTSTEGSQPQRTLDYFFQGLDYKLYFMSNSSTLPKAAIFELKVEKYSHKFRMDSSSAQTTLYTNEEIDFSCAAAEFIYNKTTLEMTILKKDGTLFPINPNSFFTYSYNDVYRIVLKRFRMSKDMAEVSCSAKGRSDGPFSGASTHELHKFTTIDPPLRLAARTVEGKLRKFQLNHTLGCTYGGSASERNQLNSKLFATLDYQDVNFIKSIIDFIRFAQFTEGNYSCINLSVNNATFDNSLEDFDYYIKIVQNVPSIEKPRGKQSFTLKGHDYRTLSCRYRGTPKPYVTWLRNGERVNYKVQILRGRGSSSIDEDEIEEALLPLPPNENSEKLVNYTCVAYSHLGQDSFSYLIVEDDHRPEASLLEQSSNFNVWIVISVLFGLTSLAMAVGFLIFQTRYMENLRKIQNPSGAPVQMQFNGGGMNGNSNGSGPTLGGHQHSANLDYEVLQEEY